MAQLSGKVALITGGARGIGGCSPAWRAGVVQRSAEAGGAGVREPDSASRIRRRRADEGQIRGLETVAASLREPGEVRRGGSSQTPAHELADLPVGCRCRDCG